MPGKLFINEISFGYSSQPVFSNFSAHIPANALIIGDNGSGKTTLLKLIAGTLLPETGSIQLNQRSHYNSAVFFNNRILFDSINIKQHMIWIKKAFHISESFLDSHNAEFIENTLLERKPSELSDGERQWAALMLTCLMPADIYLLDEPTRSLDETHFLLFNRFIQTQLENGKNFIISAHRVQNCPNELIPFQLSVKAPYLEPFDTL